VRLITQAESEVRFDVSQVDLVSLTWTHCPPHAETESRLGRRPSDEAAGASCRMLCCPTLPVVLPFFRWGSCAVRVPDSGGVGHGGERLAGVDAQWPDDRLRGDHLRFVRVSPSCQASGLALVLTRPGGSASARIQLRSIHSAVCAGAGAR
jgi:hypothetical protein